MKEGKQSIHWLFSSHAWWRLPAMLLNFQLSCRNVLQHIKHIPFQALLGCRLWDCHLCHSCLWNQLLSYLLLSPSPIVQQFQLCICFSPKFKPPGCMILLKRQWLPSWRFKWKQSQSFLYQNLWTSTKLPIKRAWRRDNRDHNSGPAKASEAIVTGETRGSPYNVFSTPF